MEEYVKCYMENKMLKPHMRETVCEEICHGVEVSNLAVLIAREMELGESFCEDIAIAGVLHDLGKMRLAKYLFSDSDTLMVEQLKYVRLHSTYSYNILKDAGYSDRIAQAVYHHHENYDGSGYPDNLIGDEIPLMARILRTCDVFAALTSERTYRGAFEPSTAMEIMIDEVGDYDMQVFLAFQRLFHSERWQGIESFRQTVSPIQKEQFYLFEKETMD